MSTADTSTGQHSPDDTGSRLADWLDGLGLTDHLGDAGLPTFVRDASGGVSWTDPATSLPMSVEQLTALETKLRAQGDDPRHGVPLQLLQLSRQARVREVLAGTACFSYESLAELRGESVNATRFAVHKAKDLHRVLLVSAGERVLIPAFQFDERGQSRLDLAEVLPPLLAAGMDPWRLWGWLTQPAALLGGLVPAEAATDPEDADIVRHAAARLAAKTAAEAPTAKRSVCH